MQLISSTVGGVVIGDTEKLLAFAEDERRKRGVAEGFVHEMAGRVLASHELDLDGKMRAVRAAIGIYAAEIAGGRTQTNLGDIVDLALARSKALADEGKSVLARASLRRAAESLKQDEEDRRSRYAESVRTLYGRERDIAFAVFDGEAAAEAIIAMADAIHPSAPADARHAITAEATTLYEYGRDRGSNVHLATLIVLRRTLLALAGPGDERGAAQLKLGTALWTLGHRESGTARLEEAVAAYRTALEESARERAPLEWARAQMGLGVALQTIGERESGTARLNEAVAAFRAGLEELPRERVPLDWAKAQNNLGAALEVLGERESGTARLEEAVVAYRAALGERARERVPLDWAQTQSNLGNALEALGERESGTARFQEAVPAYRVALEVLTRERVPLDWAKTQNNLGFALWRLGEQESGTGKLEEAIVAYRAALEERTRERVPLDWAQTQMNLGDALQTLGERESGTAHLVEAVAAWNASLDVTRCVWPTEWVRSVETRRDEAQGEIARRSTK